MPRMCLFFFFSSRRRHTRSLCDWSSDVCSSDLIMYFGVPSFGVKFMTMCVAHIKNSGASPEAIQTQLRSEERRVGKECRSRWSPDHEKETRESGEIRISKIKMASIHVSDAHSDR